MKMNKLRLTNKIENHFYLDFNWKDGLVFWSVSRRVLGWEAWIDCRDTDGLVFWSVSWRVFG